jgi:hypothetical protein
MKSILILLQIVIAVNAAAQNYSVALIPDSLLKHADMVQRADEMRIVIHSIKSATVYHKYAYTILNEKANDDAAFAELYDDFQRLSEASGTLFDAMGKKLKSVKKRDMQDRAYDDNFSLATDGRIKSHNFYYKIYPYTIEYEVEQEYNGVYEFPAWSPLDDFDCSVQKSSFTIEMPLDYKLRYKLVNGAKEPIVKNSDKIKTLQWEANNLMAMEYEPYQPPLSRLLPMVLVGPDDFEYGGYKGNLSSWDNYGKYYAALYKGRDVLPENIKATVHKLVDGLSTQQQKVEVLYSYMQQNTHYISIQLGIGGLQPFEATFVAEKKYGDCKALSNYMVALLKEAGIKANTVVIYGGKSAPTVYDDFPRHYFNHVVACVPTSKDTTWLECTSQTESAGYAGTFTGNRKALLIKDDGGELVNTPVYKANDNLQVRSIQAQIDEQGNLTANVATHFTGVQQELQHSLLHNANQEEREKYLNQALGLPTYKIEKIEYKETKKALPEMYELLKIISPNYATVTGRRMFIVPNLFNKEDKLPVNEKRHLAIVFKSSYIDIDSIVIAIPQGYTVESLPKDVVLKTKFGSYSIGFKVKDAVINLIRERRQDEGSFAATDYTALVEFFDSMAKADRSKMVLVKN